MKNYKESTNFHEILKQYKDISQNIATQIMNQRIKSGYSVADIWDYTEIDRGNYSKYENCDARPRIETLIALANLYGTTVDSFLGLSTKNTEKVVHCRDCIYWTEESRNSADRAYCHMNKRQMPGSGFCSDGAKKMEKIV